MAQVTPYMYLTLDDWKENGEAAWYSTYRYVIGTKRTLRTPNDSFEGYQFIAHYNNLTEEFEIIAVTVDGDINRTVVTNASGEDQSFADDFINDLPQNIRITNLSALDFAAIKDIWTS